MHALSSRIKIRNGLYTKGLQFHWKLLVSKWEAERRIGWGKRQKRTCFDGRGESYGLDTLFCQCMEYVWKRLAAKWREENEEEGNNIPEEALYLR